MAEARVLLDGLHFAEAPRWHDGKLWFSDFYDHAVFTVDLDGHKEHVVDVPGQPSGLGWLPDGRLLVVSMTDRRLLRLDPDGLVVHADLSHIATFHCNDMVVDAGGRAYVGNFGFNLDEWLVNHGIEAVLAEPGPPRAAIARVDPDGSVHVAADGLKFPNGTVITPDGGTMIVAETLGLRLTAFDIDHLGGLSNRRVWAQLDIMAPDGICLDAEGNVWLANAVAAECVLVAEGGSVIEKVETEHACYACALGGPDRRTLFMLTAESSVATHAAAARTGKILVADVAVGGAGRP